MSLLWYHQLMKMLREWNGQSNTLILHIIRRFGIDIEELHLIKFECLSYDSFIWYFKLSGELFDSNTYCLYAEDYVPSLSHAINTIDHNQPKLEEESKYQLVRVLQEIDWADSDPVKHSETYKPPDDQKEFMKFAATSGYDFVFLAKNSLNSR